VFLIFVVGSLSFVSNSFIDGMWVVALAPYANTLSGATFHPFAVILLISGWYFVVFLSLVSAVNMSLQYVNSINCVVFFGVGSYGGG
jgi:ABC-type amino acid transport system permease subunit